MNCESEWVPCELCSWCRRDRRSIARSSKLACAGMRCGRRLRVASRMIGDRCGCNDATDARRRFIGWMNVVQAEAAKDVLRSLERGPDALIHVVVTVLRETTDERDFRRIARKRLVPLEERLVLGARHRVIGVALVARVLAHDRRSAMRLSRQMTKLRDPREIFVVGVVLRAHFLVSRGVGK